MMFFGEIISNAIVSMSAFHILATFMTDVLHNMENSVKNNLILRRFKYFHFEM